MSSSVDRSIDRGIDGRVTFDGPLNPTSTLRQVKTNNVMRGRGARGGRQNLMNTMKRGGLSS